MLIVGLNLLVDGDLCNSIAIGEEIIATVVGVRGACTGLRPVEVQCETRKYLLKSSHVGLD